MPIHIHTCMHAYIPRACIHAYIHIYIHTYIHTYMHTCTGLTEWQITQIKAILHRGADSIEEGEGTDRGEVKEKNIYILRVFSDDEKQHLEKAYRCVCVCVCVCVCMHACTYVRSRIYMCVCVCEREKREKQHLEKAYRCVCVCICMYVCEEQNIHVCL